MAERDDWELVAQAQQGDLHAFAALVARYQTPVVHFCQRMTGSIEDAEEVAQECFVRLFRHLARLEPQARFSTVVFGIARNLALNHLRDRGRRGRHLARPLEQAPESRADAQAAPDRQARLREIEAALEAAIGQLSAEHREVLLMREMQGMDYETIAGIAGCRVGTVKSRLARARDQLRMRLEAMGGDW